MFRPIFREFGRRGFRDAASASVRSMIFAGGSRRFSSSVISLIVEQKSIGLKRVLNSLSRRTVFLLISEGLVEEIDSQGGGFTSLKSEVDFIDSI